MLVNGYEGCLEVQALNKWHEGVNVKFCRDPEELVKQIAYGAQAILPLYNSIYGHNWSLYRMLDTFDYKIVDEVEIAPEFYLAANNDNFEIVTATEPILSLTDEHWRKHRSYLLQPSETVETALKRTQQYNQYATICTLEEAKQYKFSFFQKVQHQQLNQQFAIVAKDLSKEEYESFSVLIQMTKYKTDSLNLLTYAFANHEVLIEDLFMLNQQNLIVRIKDDYRRARVRTIFNQLKDLGMSSVKVLGGKLLVD
ncbi:hypothetical protein COV81_05155 [Candidatus Peregrinibacteria bacterium CG11_big_fil_rev_8_21_14_0_20_41_10]|nr:MAG: hypothetical protein COV81_05155 [Candidatus Peregrinibacteria bacterium CG11_big_fil_rev_8_21_14_0_20_41_10]PIZ76906.1 MAG: hypothetical protein COY06_01150 [Candidatus Peregrinibacteria bacterium CG_4_10_14_0_2_um_filter_41_8]PJC37812.1 MAG: hypothetical protein CO045_03530 [Candidatus Peregrinibacteria bacterium CG_4_9_14_0_2_um_filter_41_14]